MSDWDMNGDTTRTGYEAQLASLRAQLAVMRDALEIIARRAEPDGFIQKRARAALTEVGK